MILVNFIYKTDKNIYIYNEYIEEVEKYSTSEEFKSSFTFPNTQNKSLNHNTLYLFQLRKILSDTLFKKEKALISQS